MAGVSAARKAAFRILMSIERGDGHSDELLRADAVNKLAAPDRNLTTALVLGVLRWQPLLDAQIRLRLARPNAKLDAEINVALRLGAFQLMYLDRVPAHAAIDESVELAKQAGHKFAAGMVNAVLRNLAAAREERLRSPADVQFRIESRAAYPAWMVERWMKWYGAETVYAICAHGQRQPQLSLRTADAKVEQELADEGVQLEPGLLLTAARTVVSGDATTTKAFRAGRVRIQDEGSQLVAEIAACALSQCGSGDRRSLRENLRVLDACAAPGGKTLVLADRLPQAHIVACEASPVRHAALRARMMPYANQVDCWLCDASTLGEEESFDLVLVDAPCSGTGTLGRNPEIRYRLREDDLARQAERQKAILGAALRAVKREGRVVYSTCSLEPEENERVVAEVAARIIPMGACIEEMRCRGVLTDAGARELAACLTTKGALRLVPGTLGSDGYFVAVLEKG